MSKWMLLAAGLILAGCSPQDLPGELRTDHEVVDLDRSELTRVDLRMGAGEMHIRGGAKNLMEGDFTYNVESWKPEVEHRSTGMRGDLIIRQPEGARIPGHSEYRWDVRLNEEAMLDIAAHLGAGEATFDIGNLNLRNVDLDIGVGEVNMDLRGTPRRSYDVRINGGVGEATIHLPDNVGIVATASGGIGEINVSGLENRNGRWIRAGHENDPVVIRLDAKGGVGEIRIIAD